MAKRNDIFRLNLITIFNQFAQEIYEYENLPEEIPVWAIERYLFYNGFCTFFQVGGKYFVQRCANVEGINIYGEMSLAQPISENGSQWEKVRIIDNYEINGDSVKILPQNAVLIKNNVDRISTNVLIRPLIERLAYIFESIGIVESVSRVKILLKCDDNQRNVLKNNLKNVIDNSDNIIVVSNKYNENNVESLDLNIDSSVDNQWADFDYTFNLLMTFLGVDNNSQQDKRERLVTAEVDKNMMIIDIFKKRALKFRQLAVDQINKLFGLNIKIKQVGMDENKLVDKMEKIETVEDE